MVTGVRTIPSLSSILSQAEIKPIFTSTLPEGRSPFVGSGIPLGTNSRPNITQIMSGHGFVPSRMSPFSEEPAPSNTAVMRLQGMKKCL